MEKCYKYIGQENFSCPLPDAPQKYLTAEP